MTFPEAPTPDERLISVVVPVRNEEAGIGACLASIQAQTAENLEILVVDGRSEDRTREIVAELAAADSRIRLLDNPQRIAPTAMNVGLAAAHGAYLVRIDGHATVPPDYVAIAVGHLRSGRWGGVGGRKDGVGTTAAGKAVAAAMSSRFGVGTGSTYHHGIQVRTADHIPFGVYRTGLARDLGGWNEDLVTNQDYEFDYRLRRAGHELLFDPALHIDWQCQQSIGGLYRQYRRYGQGKAQVLRLHPASAKPRQILPGVLVVGLGIGTTLLAHRRTRPLGLLATVPYAAGVGAASVATAGRLPQWDARLRLPAAFAAMHVGWGVGLLRGLAGRFLAN